MVQYRNSSAVFQRYVRIDDGKAVLAYQVPDNCDIVYWRILWKQPKAEHGDYLVKPAQAGYPTNHHIVKEKSFEKNYRFPH